MKGLEEELESEELTVEFRKKVVIHLSMIVFSASCLLKEIVDYIEKKNETES